jgi:hypothetical protein|tara:strand:+ start:116 stop:703 length:588 start_codon:yes stop_codon:yes gene_type:complete
MKFEGPIPGENFLTDTKNYPWHRPPDLVDYDETVSYMLSKIDEPEQIELVFAMLGIDAKVTTVVSTLLLQAISKGKFTIDMAMLIAGPLARYIEIQAKNAGVKYDMGLENKDRIVLTPTLLKASLGILEQPEEESPEIMAMREEAGPMEPEQEQIMGLMSQPPEGAVAEDDEQAAMLGQTEEEVVQDSVQEEEAA